MLVPKRSTLGLAGVATAVAVALGGCGGSGSTAGAPVNVPASVQIRRAADISSAAKGYRFRMTIDETVPAAGQSFTITGTGALSSASHSGRLALTMDGAGQHVRIPEVILGSTIYMKEPAAVAAKLPGGKPWLKLDLSKLSKSSYLSSLQAVSNSSWQDPTQSFTYLRAEAHHIEDLAQVTVNGQTLNHYRMTINLTKAGVGQPASLRRKLQTLLHRLPGTILNETSVPADVWIDSSGRIRKLSVKMKLMPTGYKTTVDTTTTMRFLAYGPQPTPKPPPAAETNDMIAILRAEGKLSQLNGG